MMDLIHTGVGHDDDPPGRGSGRFAWGSGENPHQHQFNFLSEVNILKKKGLSQAEIAAMLLGPKYYMKDGTPVYYNSTDLRAEIAIQTKKERQANYAKAVRLLEECNGNVSEVARRMSNETKTWNESSIRSLLNPAIMERTNRYENTAEMLKKVIAEKGIIDISTGVELGLGITANTKNVAVSMLEKEGYTKTQVRIPQGGTNYETTINVLAPPGMSYGEIQQKKFEVQSVLNYTPDEGKTWWTPEFPESLDSKRIFIRYGEDGGKEKDGVIELRPGVEDISLGGSQYAQVRIAVDGTHYMKGMAVYANDIPKGYDVVYNTNKSAGTPMIGDPNHEVLKRLKVNSDTGEVDRNNPFGALIKSPKEQDGVLSAGGQRYYVDKDGVEKLSPINKLRDEGDWDSWSRNLSAQFLAKQPLQLINQQMDISLKQRKLELEEIKSLTNPVIKQKLLEDFANNCDSNAADLSVKGFKKQAFQVILPVKDMKDNEIYAPNYKDGDTVALVRYPHGGTFEIPILKVNNKQKTAEAIITKHARDAVGINTKVAEQLSGADFDGDTVLVIPMTSNRISITARNPLPGLKNFDPKLEYKLPDDAPYMKSKTKQNEMGRVTNLITDMTVGGATYDQIERAVRHSMVVIDAEKHHLNYKQSAKDNRISDLKEEFQGGKTSGASTILSKAHATTRVDNYKEITDTKKMTPKELERWNEGKKVLRPTGDKIKEQVKDPKKMTQEELKLYEAGKKVYRTTSKSKQTEVHWMDTVDDAMDLVRDPYNKKEVAYANYANSLKSLANQARKESRNIGTIPVNQSAKRVYAAEVESLNRKLRIAESNSPKERRAQVIMNSMVSETFKSNPDMDYEHKQRERALALTRARAIVGAKKEPVVITDREWEAIQANAISTNKLRKIVNNTDQEAFKKRATPHKTTELSNAQLAYMKALYASGMYTQAEIAEVLGVSTSTISKALKS